MQNSSFQNLSFGSKSSFGQTLVNQSKSSFQSKTSAASRKKPVQEPQDSTDSCKSLRSTQSEYFQSALPKKDPRTLTYQDQLVNMKRIVARARKDADQVLRTANEIANKTANIEAEYHAGERVPPELIFMEHARFLNGRILRAEEAKIRMECTPELTDGINRRYLPQTIGRRNQVVEADIQEVQLQREYNRCFDVARDILVKRQDELQSQLDTVYRLQLAGIRPVEHEAE